MFFSRDNASATWVGKESCAIRDQFDQIYSITILQSLQIYKAFVTAFQFSVKWAFVFQQINSENAVKKLSNWP
jgi:hypothetical protein